MNRGLIITGLAFIIAVVLIASVNYVVIGRQSQEEAVKQKMKIDAVIDRNHETYLIIEEAVQDGMGDSADCPSAANVIENYINTALDSGTIDTGPVNVEGTAMVDGSTCPDIQVNVDYTVETDDGDVHKERSYSKTFTY